MQGTQFGREHALDATTSYVQFQATVPPRAYEYFEPLVQRMIAGEPNVLTKGKTLFLAETASTTGTQPKLLPVPESMLKHYRQGLRDAFFLYSARVGHTGVFLGRHLHTGASTALKEQNGTYRTSLDGMIALSLMPWVEANIHSPPPAVANLPEGPQKNLATARCMVGRDVTLIAGRSLFVVGRRP